MAVTTGSLTNLLLAFYTDSLIIGSSNSSNSVIAGTANIVLSGSFIGNISGSFTGLIYNQLLLSYTSSLIFISTTLSIDITGSFNGSLYIYNYIGTVSGSVTGSAYVTDYTGTYTYLSQSVANTTLLVSDPSNAPYLIIPYSKINSAGKTWIMLYGYALVKLTLGMVRSKYNTIPIPGDLTTMDGDTLRNLALTMKLRMILQLKLYLDSVTKTNLMLRQNMQNEYLRLTLKGIPTKIYIG